MIPVPLPGLNAELQKFLLIGNSVTLIAYLFILEMTSSSPVKKNHLKTRKILQPFNFVTFLFIVIVCYAAWLQFGSGK